jgi:hypothetical protein
MRKKLNPIFQVLIIKIDEVSEKYFLHTIFCFLNYLIITSKQFLIIWFL